MSTQDEFTKLIDGWIKSQMGIWKCWTDQLAPSSQGGHADLWRQCLESTERSIHGTLDAQARSMEKWASNLAGMEHGSAEMEQWARQGVEMATRWSQLQRQMWDQWLDLLRGLPAAPPAGGTGEGFLEQWQQMSKQIVAAQDEWAKRFRDGLGTPDGAASTRKR